MPQARSRSRHVYRVLGSGGQAGLVGVGIAEKTPGNDGRAIRHVHWSAVQCLSGAARFRGPDGREQAIGPGMLFQRFPRLAHSLDIAADPPWREAWVALGPPSAEALVAFGISDPARPVLQGPDPAATERRVGELAAELAGADAAALPALAARVFALAVDLLSADRREDAADPRVAAACRALGDDPRRDLHELAASLGLSYERFRKAFRAGTGQSPGGYRIQRRIERARSLLLEPGMTVQRAALELGYPDAFTFSAQFRRVVGTSPRAWQGRRNDER